MTPEEFTDAFASVFQIEATRTWLEPDQPVDPKKWCVLIPISEDWSSCDIFIADLAETKQWMESIGGPEATQPLRDESGSGFWTVGVVPDPDPDRLLIRLVVWSVQLLVPCRGGEA